MQHDCSSDSASPTDPNMTRVTDRPMAIWAQRPVLEGLPAGALRYPPCPGRRSLRPGLRGAVRPPRSFRGHAERDVRARVPGAVGDRHRRGVARGSGGGCVPACLHLGPLSMDRTSGHAGHLRGPIARIRRHLEGGAVSRPSSPRTFAPLISTA
jgi:hypothetical protein